MSKLARNAPSVRYPFRRSGVLGLFLLAAGLLGAVALLAWCLQGSRLTAAPGALAVAGILWLVVAGCAFQFWLAQPVGTIHWDGQAWSVATLTGLAQDEARALSAPPAVFLDMQSHLWVHVLPAGRRGLWLWLDRSGQPERWMDLRRAVYSRAKPGVDPDAIAPAGSRGA